MRTTLRYVLLNKKQYLFFIFRSILVSLQIIETLPSHVLEPLDLGSACVMSMFYIRETRKMPYEDPPYFSVTKVWKLLHSENLFLIFWS